MPRGSCSGASHWRCRIHREDYGDFAQKKEVGYPPRQNSVKAERKRLPPLRCSAGRTEGQISLWQDPTSQNRPGSEGRSCVVLFYAPGVRQTPASLCQRGHVDSTHESACFAPKNHPRVFTKSHKCAFLPCFPGCGRSGGVLGFLLLLKKSGFHGFYPHNSPSPTEESGGPAVC